MSNPDSSIPWKTLKVVLGDALELPAGDRVAWVQEKCGEDTQLRDAVLTLLPEDDHQEGFMEAPAVVATLAREPKTGDRLGHYQLGRLLGEGGMGQVFEATQERPQRTVALKVLRPGLFSQKAAQRFEWEAEVLGKLSHRAIAKIWEAGEEVLPDGNRLSWFAMEQVHGEPMLQAASNLGLDRRACLRLFLEVCEGVSHAHRRGIIHRDLKPDNVLVDGAGRPHILDFGIARSLDPEDPHQTMEGDIVGTLAYMSPEQVQGDLELIDARTDVFSLGVILYRMLSGRAPHELRGLTVTEVAKRLTEERPTPIGQVDPTLRGDLETILEVALAREPERRYGSVDGLAADVRAYLEDRPVSARPPTAVYHLTMFARRHKVLVAAASMIIVLLIATIVGTSFGLNKATQARDVAQLERDRAQATLDFITKVFSSADPEEGGRGVLLVDLLKTAALDLEANKSLTEGIRGALHLTLGETFAAIDDTVGAQHHLEKATQLLARNDGPLAPITLRAHSAWIRSLLGVNRVEDARVQCELVKAGIAESFDPAGTPLNPETMILHTLPKRLDADVLWAEGHTVEAELLFGEIYHAWKEHAPDESNEVDLARLDWSVALLQIGEYQRAEPLIRETLAEHLEHYPELHPRVFTARSHLASVLSDQGNQKEALAIYEAMLPQAVTLWGPTHRHVLTIRGNRAVELEIMGEHEQAYAEQRELVEISTKELGEHHPNTLVRKANAAGTATSLGRFDEAGGYFQEVLNVYDETETDPFSKLVVLSNLAFCLDRQGRLEEALLIARRATADYVEHVGEGNMQTLISRNNLAILLMKVEHSDDAVTVATHNLELAQEHVEGHPYITFPFRMNLGRCLAAAGRFEEAEVELLAVHATLDQDPNASDVAKARINEVLAQTYTAWDKTEEAARFLPPSDD